MLICYRICDILECSNNDEEFEIYNVTEEAAKEIIKLYPVKNTNENDFHICENCLKELISEFTDKFEIENEILRLKNEK